jgi:Flp pilus assembly protein TadD
MTQENDEVAVLGLPFDAKSSYRRGAAAAPAAIRAALACPDARRGAVSRRPPGTDGTTGACSTGGGPLCWLARSERDRRQDDRPSNQPMEGSISVMRASTAWILLLLLASAGLAASSAQDVATREDATDVPDANLLGLEPEMAKFLVKQIGPKQARSARLNGLIDAIFGKDGLGIKYGNTRTKTAAETFRERSGNCLSFTFLFVAMARHLGLDAYFMEVSEVLSWDQRGEVVVSNQHMFAEVEIDNGTVAVDFLPGVEKRYFSVHRIGDQRALAHYYNNLGAERLTAGDPAGAVALFHKALESDPTLGPALVNLGYAERRLEDFAGAEASYLRALEVQPGDPSASANLASLYLAQGRDDEAQPYLHRVTSHQLRNPFHHYQLAMQRAAAGDVAAAIRHLKDAVRRDPGAPMFHAALADLYLEAGDRENALESLRKAIRTTTDDGQKAELERRLAAAAAKPDGSA